jgi:hypothetical protein
MIQRIPSASPPGRTDLGGDLIGGTADTPGFDLDHRFHVFQRFLKHL